MIMTDTKRDESATPFTWLLFGVVIAAEIAGALGLRFSERFTVALPTVMSLMAFTLALYLVSNVMRRLPVKHRLPGLGRRGNRVRGAHRCLGIARAGEHRKRV